MLGYRGSRANSDVNAEYLHLDQMIHQILRCRTCHPTVPEYIRTKSRTLLRTPARVLRVPSAGHDQQRPDRPHLPCLSTQTIRCANEVSSWQRRSVQRCLGEQGTAAHCAFLAGLRRIRAWLVEAPKGPYGLAPGRLRSESSSSGQKLRPRSNGATCPCSTTVRLGIRRGLMVDQTTEGFSEAVPVRHRDELAPDQYEPSASPVERPESEPLGGTPTLQP